METRMLVQDSFGSVGDPRLVEALMHKWGSSLSHVPVREELDKQRVANTAILCENFARIARNLNEDTLQTNVGNYTKFAYKMLLDTFPNLIAHDLVSVQAITSPIGIILYADIIYETTKGSVSAGTITPRNFNANYTSEYIDGAILATADGTNYGPAAAALSSVVTFVPVRPATTDGKYSVLIREIDATTGATVQQGAFLSTGAADTSTGISAGTINFSNGALAGVRFDTLPVNGNAIRLYYTYDGEANPIRPRMKFDVKKLVVEAVPRRLVTSYSFEALMDARNTNGMNLESQLSTAAMREISTGIDRDIINQMFRMSVVTPATFDRLPPSGIAEIDHLRALITVMSKVSNLIHMKTLRAPANRVVTSPEASALFEQFLTHSDLRPIFTSGPDNAAPIDMPLALGTPGQFGIYRAGTLQNKWKTYVDPFFQRDYIMLALRGDDISDAGLIWSPYTLLESTAPFLDPAKGEFIRGFQSRDVITPIRAEHYGQVRILHL